MSWDHSSRERGGVQSMKTGTRENLTENPAIFSLSTAVPPFVYEQRHVAHQFQDILQVDEEKARFLKRIYENSSIDERWSVIGDFHKSRQEWEFWGAEYPKKIPGMSRRNLRYKKEAPLLAEKAARQALERWGGDLSKISHIISVSCTGVMAPGIEYHLMQKLGLLPTINRLGINFMGCFGAFKGLSVAGAFSRENPDSRILIVCTELCTLHLQAHLDEETLTGNSLFSDGASAAIVGGNPGPQESPLFEIIRTHSLGFENSLDKMSWEASDSGFQMRLCRTVPVLIRRQMKEFASGLLVKGVEAEHCDWAIHPGGKSILQAIEKALQLEDAQTESSWKTLSKYGNMSSASFLFVLDELSRKKDRRGWTAGVGFGPGLSFEGILLSSGASCLKK